MDHVKHTRLTEWHCGAEVEYLPILHTARARSYIEKRETMEINNFVAKLLVAFWLAMLKMDSLSDFNSWHSSISAELERGEEQYGTLEEQPAHARNCSRLLISIH